MILIGLGLGTGMQTFVLVVQNAVDQEHGDELLGQRRLHELSQALLKDCRDCDGDGDSAGGDSRASDGTAAVTSVGLDPTAQFEHALSDAPAELRGRLRAVVDARSPTTSLSSNDLTALERIGMAASAALLHDLTHHTA